MNIKAFFTGYKIFILCLTLFLTLSSFAQDDCILPAGVTRGNGYLQGTISLATSDNSSQNVILHVKDVNTYPQTICPSKIYQQTTQLWQNLYQTLVQRGMTKSNLETMIKSISEVSGSGIYIEPQVNACGYNGLGRRITCSAGTGDWEKETMAHENMHGWEFQQFGNNTDASIQFYMAFASFANDVYLLEKERSTKLKGTSDGRQWDLNYLTYGLQNEAEWGSEVFADWTFNGVSRAVWPFIDAHKPKYKEYFNCLWKTDTTPAACANKLNRKLDLPSNDPVKNPPIYMEGFTKAQSKSIWKVCFNDYRNTAAASDYSTVDSIIQTVAPNLPPNPSKKYQLAYGDFNHDGTVDYACWYTGRGPVNVGNGQYLWNKEYKKGTFTFVVSGKDIGYPTYAEYKTDPYLTMPSINGSLAQPMFREWQGKYGSANGSNTYAVHSGNTWYSKMSKNLGTQWSGVFGPLSPNLLQVGNVTWKNNTKEKLSISWITYGGQEIKFADLSAGEAQVYGAAYYVGVNVVRDESNNIVLVYVINGSSTQEVAISQSALNNAKKNALQSYPEFKSLPANDGREVSGFVANNHSGKTLKLNWIRQDGTLQLIDELQPGKSSAIDHVYFGGLFTLNELSGKIVNVYVATDAPNQSMTVTDDLINFWD